MKYLILAALAAMTITTAQAGGDVATIPPGWKHWSAVPQSEPFKSTDIPEATVENALEMAASVIVYQRKCLNGKFLDNGMIETVATFMDAAGLDIKSKQTQARIQLEILRKTLFIEENYPNDKAFCQKVKG